jgi:hypothetical protein
MKLRDRSFSLIKKEKTSKDFFWQSVTQRNIRFFSSNFFFFYKKIQKIKNLSKIVIRKHYYNKNCN